MPLSRTANAQPASSRLAETATTGGRPSWNFSALAMRFWKTRDSPAWLASSTGSSPTSTRPAVPRRVELDLGHLGLAGLDCAHQPVVHAHLDQPRHRLAHPRADLARERDAHEPLGAGVRVAEDEVDDGAIVVADRPHDPDRV